MPLENECRIRITYKTNTAQVNAAWAGLGYYRRARLLHAGARHVVAEMGGQLPRMAAALLAIPGVGPYSAGAIASIAFGARSPIVDGNVIRVLARLRACAADPKADKAFVKHCWALAEGLVEGCADPGDLNQVRGASWDACSGALL